MDVDIAKLLDDERKTPSVAQYARAIQRVFS
jgi:hypothetical protein